MVDGFARAFMLPQAEASAALVHGIAIAIICYAWARADAVARGTLAPGRSALYADDIHALDSRARVGHAPY